jgi:hypothetical protein
VTAMQHQLIASLANRLRRADDPPPARRRRVLSGEELFTDPFGLGRGEDIRRPVALFRVRLAATNFGQLLATDDEEPKVRPCTPPRRQEHEEALDIRPARRPSPSRRGVGKRRRCRRAPVRSRSLDSSAYRLASSTCAEGRASGRAFHGAREMMQDWPGVAVAYLRGERRQVRLHEWLDGLEGTLALEHRYAARRVRRADGGRPNTRRSSVFACSSRRLSDEESDRPARLMYRFSIDMADWNFVRPFVRRLRSADRLRLAAIAFGDR